MIFFVLESHRALDVRRAIDERAQRIARERVIVSARVHVIEAGCLEKCRSASTP